MKNTPKKPTKKQIEDAVKEVLGVKESISSQMEYTVQSFMNSDGDNCNRNPEKATIIIVMDKYKVSFPFSLRTVKNLNLKIGDKFTETRTYQKVR